MNRIVALLHVFISLTRTVALQLIHVKGHSTRSGVGRIRHITDAIFS